MCILPQRSICLASRGTMRSLPGRSGCVRRRRFRIASYAPETRINDGTLKKPYYSRLPVNHHLHPCFKLSQTSLLHAGQIDQGSVSTDMQTKSLEFPCAMSENKLPPFPSAYAHACERRVQVEHAGFSPGQRVFFLLSALPLALPERH